MPFTPFVVRAGLAACLLLAAALPAAAQVQVQQAPLPEASPALIESSSRQWLDQEVNRASPAAGLALRMEVSVGSLDPRLHLAACNRVEPYIPAGMRLWGRTRLGLRCVDGPVRWNVFLPVQVKAFGPGWVARGPIAAGATLAQNDAMQAEIDWADDAATVLGDANQWVGSVAVRSLVAGQALRQNLVRAPQVFEAGSQVRVVAQGSGYSVTSDGQAMGAGVIGQIVRVRMEGGRTMTGTVVDSRTVRIEI